MNARNLLCVANFPTGTGYAWEAIEELFADLADDLARWGVRTWVAYPEVTEHPSALSGTKAEPLEMAFSLRSLRQLARIIRIIRRRKVATLYLTDKPGWHPAYVLLRLAGLRTIVVHQRTAGPLRQPTGSKYLFKSLSRLFTPALADTVVAVSEYVARHRNIVDLIPRDRIVVAPNAVDVPACTDRQPLRRRFMVDSDRPIVVCASRAVENKGVQYLLEAFDRVASSTSRAPVLIYFGDGPYLENLRDLRAGLENRDSVILAGYRSDVKSLLGGADLCVVPSTVEEGFGRAALEPAAHGVPVVASRVGGIPEVVSDGETGILVPPGDVEALEAAILDLLQDEEKRLAMGRNARRRVEHTYSLADQRERLRRIFREALLGDRKASVAGGEPSEGFREAQEI